jgi:hypothetical protein
MQDVGFVVQITILVFSIKHRTSPLAPLPSGEEKRNASARFDTPMVVPGYGFGSTATDWTDRERASGSHRADPLTDWKKGINPASNPRLLNCRASVYSLAVSKPPTTHARALFRGINQEFVYDKRQRYFDLQFLSGRSRARFLDKLDELCAHGGVVQCPYSLVVQLTPTLDPSSGLRYAYRHSNLQSCAYFDQSRSGTSFSR